MGYYMANEYKVGQVYRVKGSDKYTEFDFDQLILITEIKESTYRQVHFKVLKNYLSYDYFDDHFSPTSFYDNNAKLISESKCAQILYKL